MKDKNFIDKLLKIVVILIILITSIVLYNSVITYFTQEAYRSDSLKCVEGNMVDDYGIILEEGACTSTTEYYEEKDNEYKQRKLISVIQSIYVLLLGIGLLVLLNKKDLLKEGVIIKILNAILVLITFLGLSAFGSALLSGLSGGINTEAILNTFGFAAFPVIFYYILNKYLLKKII